MPVVAPDTRCRARETGVGEVRLERSPEEELAPIPEDRVAHRALAADKLADTSAGWARFALESVL